ncbi:MAG: hypothetical protein SH819_08405 [Cytophagales bacterium]|nr:hypothetical protein [Cytophagales bacterium]
MSSLIPNFEYDIFISYRHNDNRYDGWVTEFVDNLQKELEATVKGKITIYFDKNPVDGLHESHNVDASLAPKLKSLIFIPIISKTYCDPGSFAWNNEFLAFIKTAETDSFGLNIKLKSGNVATRVLPVRIHDLDQDDVTLLESSLKSKLRPIDFIFKSTGVNRPLRTHEDEPKENQNHTFYRDQINKVANAIGETISAMKQPVVQNKEEKTSPPAPTAGKSKSFSSTKILIATISLMILFALAYGISQFVGTGETTKEKSIAVLPFENMSGDKEQDYFSNGMMEEILNQLVKIRDLKVISRTSSMVYKDSKLSLREIASALGAANIVEGSVRKSGGKVRITVQLIEASTDNHLWSETFDRDLNDIFSIQTEISKGIARELKAILTSSEVKLLEQIPTTSPEAYDYFLQAKELYNSGLDWPNITKLYDKAIESDPKFTLAYLERSRVLATWFFNKANGWEGTDQRAKSDWEKATALSPDLVEIKLGQARLLYFTERKYEEVIDILELLKTDYPNNAALYSLLGSVQRRKGLWREAMQNQEKSIMLEPNNPQFYFETARLHFALRNYARALQYYNKTPMGIGFKDYVNLSWTGNPEVAFKDADVNEQGKHYFKREFEDLLKILDTTKSEIHEGEVYYSPRELDFAQLHYLNHNPNLSKLNAIKAIAILERKVKESPNDFRVYAALGQARAFAGNYDQAIAAGKKACEMMPVALDAFLDGVSMEQNLVTIYIVCGKYDLAMDKIEYLLTIPGVIEIGNELSHEYNYSVPLLRVDPMFDNLRNLPRFKKILATEYKTVY